MKTTLSLFFLSCAITLSSLQGMGNSPTSSPKLPTNKRRGADFSPITQQKREREVSDLKKPTIVSARESDDFQKNGLDIEHTLRDGTVGDLIDLWFDHPSIAQKPIDYKLKTILHIAASIGDFEKISYVLLFKTDPTKKDAKNKTPSDCAEESGYGEIAELLRLCEAVHKATEGNMDIYFNIISDSQFNEEFLRACIRIYELEQNKEKAFDAYSRGVSCRSDGLREEVKRLETMPHVS